MKTKLTTKPMTTETLNRFKEALKICKTGKDSKGSHYNSIGTLNQAAWIGENSGCLIAEIERLWGASIQIERAIQLLDQINEDGFLGRPWLEAVKGVRALLNGDGAIAMKQGITTDSKDNGAVEAMFWNALSVAGFTEGDC